MPSSTPLPTSRQRQYLDAIRAHVATRGRPPTLGELAELMNVAGRSVALDAVRGLVRAGLIKRVEAGRRTQYWPVENCPTCGQKMKGSRL